jgi:GNAT superfamily N-acetyltransferase
MPTITQATAADIPALCELLTILFSQEAEFTPDLQAQARGLERIINNSEVGIVFVCKEEGRAVGMVNLLFTVSTALGETVALLEDMVVAPSHRGSGAGSQLLSHAIAVAKQQGCKRITLLTDADNADAQRFYARHGFARSDMIPLRLILEN